MPLLCCTLKLHACIVMGANMWRNTLLASPEHAKCSLTSGVAVFHLQCATAYVTYCAATMVCTSAVRVFITGSHRFWPMPGRILSLVRHHFISHLQKTGRDALREIGRQRLPWGRDGTGKNLWLHCCPAHKNKQTVTRQIPELSYCKIVI